MTSFSALPLRPELVAATERLGYAEPTPIQVLALPVALTGRDLVAQAKTGSGKTAAFGLTLLQRLPPVAPPGAPVALVLGPTRELVEQVAESIRKLAQCRPNTRVLVLSGGVPLRPQRQALEQGVHIVVATPGRALDHIERGHLDLSAVRSLVLDEADRMLDMGFAEQVHELVSHCPVDRQTLLFSATFPERIEALSAQIQRSAERVAVDTDLSASVLRQEVVHCSADRRLDTVARVLAYHDPASALIFCETRQDCDALHCVLAECGASVLTLHGGLEQRERDDVLVQFANGSARFLVATDVAARGLDIAALAMVVQAELSPDPKVHTHRIGRTARAGAEGCAVSVVATAWEVERLRAIEADGGAPIPVVTLPDVDPVPRFRPARYRTLLLLAGRKHKIRKGDVLGALVKDVGLPPDAIGAIHLSQRICAVAVERKHAVRALRGLRRGRVKKQRVRVTLLGSAR